MERPSWAPLWGRPCAGRPSPGACACVQRTDAARWSSRSDAVFVQCPLFRWGLRWQRRSFLGSPVFLTRGGEPLGEAGGRGSGQHRRALGAPTWGEGGQGGRSQEEGSVSSLIAAPHSVEVAAGSALARSDPCGLRPGGQEAGPGLGHHTDPTQGQAEDPWRPPLKGMWSRPGRGRLTLGHHTEAHPPTLLDGCRLGGKHLRMGLRLPTLSPRWGAHLWPMLALSGDRELLGRHTDNIAPPRDPGPVTGAVLEGPRTLPATSEPQGAALLPGHPKRIPSQAPPWPLGWSRCHPSRVGRRALGQCRCALEQAGGFPLTFLSSFSL